jgi:tRNA(Ile)-lysidine synthase
MISVEVQTQKNLLAFSAGIDSTALFFILLKQQIPFDIAIVNYHQRQSSNDEVLYAQQLASKYNKNIYIKDFPKDKKFSEKLARDFRYDFFEEVIKENGYESLITAHQLNDKLEWFLMQLSSGAGVRELLSMTDVYKKNNITYYKPLLNYDKKQLQNFLDSENIKYFIDETNLDQKYKRNYIRKNFSNEFLEQYKDGVLKSFEYLQKDYEELKPTYQERQIGDLKLFICDKQNDHKQIYIIDQELKQRGIMISSDTRNEILDKKEVVISHSISVSIIEEKIFIAPYETKTMEKDFKEFCRVNRLPKNIRGYLSNFETKEIAQKLL